MRKTSLSILFIIYAVSTNIYAYEKKPKIDMHGGKEDSLTKSNSLNMLIGLGTVLNKKGSDLKDNKDNKKFIPIEQKDSIESIEIINK